MKSHSRKVIFPAQCYYDAHFREQNFLKRSPKADTATLRGINQEVEMYRARLGISISLGLTLVALQPALAGPCVVCGFGQGLSDGIKNRQEQKILQQEIEEKQVEINRQKECAGIVELQSELGFIPPSYCNSVENSSKKIEIYYIRTEGDSVVYIGKSSISALNAENTVYRYKTYTVVGPSKIGKVHANLVVASVKLDCASNAATAYYLKAYLRNGTVTGFGPGNATTVATPDSPSWISRQFVCNPKREESQVQLLTGDQIFEDAGARIAH